MNIDNQLPSTSAGIQPSTIAGIQPDYTPKYVGRIPEGRILRSLREIRQDFAAKDQI